MASCIAGPTNDKLPLGVATASDGTPDSRSEQHHLEQHTSVEFDVLRGAEVFVVDISCGSCGLGSIERDLLQTDDGVVVVLGVWSDIGFGGGRHGELGVMGTQ